MSDVFERYRGHDISLDGRQGTYVVEPYGIGVSTLKAAHDWIDAHIARESGRTNPKVGFTTKSGKVVNFTARKNGKGARKNGLIDTLLGRGTDFDDMVIAHTAAGLLDPDAPWASIADVERAISGNKGHYVDRTGKKWSKASSTRLLALMAALRATAAERLRTTVLPASATPAEVDTLSRRRFAYAAPARAIQNPRRNGFGEAAGAAGAAYREAGRATALAFREGVADIKAAPGRAVAAARARIAAEKEKIAAKRRAAAEQARKKRVNSHIDALEGEGFSVTLTDASAGLVSTRMNKGKKRKPAKKPAAKKPAARASVGKDKATFKFYVVFRGPPNGVNIHAGFATQKAARAYITKNFKGTRRLQVRGRPGLVKSGHSPKVAKNWKKFNLAASLKAMPAPRKKKPAAKKKAPARRNAGGKFQGFTEWESERIRKTSDYLGKDILRHKARRERVAAELEARTTALLATPWGVAGTTEEDYRRRRKKGLTRKVKPVYSREYLEAKGMPRRNPAAKKKTGGGRR